MRFYDELSAATEAERNEFTAIPLIGRAIADGVDRALYVEFLTSAYHHVSHTVPLLALAIARCGSGDEIYRKGLLTYIDEEVEHDEWILEDIADMGGDAVAVRNGQGPFPVRMMVAYAYHMIDRVSPYCLLGMVHVLEGMSVALAIRAADSIRSKLGMAGGKGFSYLTSHGALDVSHVEIFASLLDQVDTPERRKVVIGAAKDFYRLYGDVFRELGKGA
ncbi:MAG: iron-containing redox enzyme family protein [Magnetospirillum sp.]|nr:MAG: iron-containing redox enzyme family protein [Magnetospirillum sp.]